jgi:hypothetical protein
MNTIETLDAILADTGSFFAFSKDQMNRAKVEGVKYSSLGGGLIVPTENVTEFMTRFEAMTKATIEKDLKENGKKKIIWRELANYEAQIIGDISDTVSALEDYGITKEEIQHEFKAYMAHCIEHDLF